MNLLFVGLRSYSDLYWNDSRRYKNCVRVSTARYFGLQVTELEKQVGKILPQAAHRCFRLMICCKVS